MRRRGFCAARLFLPVLLGITLATSVVDAKSGTKIRGYTLGVFPYLPLVKLTELYEPVAADLAKTLDRPVRLRTKPTFAEWFDEVKSQRYDIVWIQPFYYIEAHDNYGYLPLAKIEEDLSAILMAKNVGTVQKIGDLRGKTVALPPPGAAVSHLTKVALVEAGLVPGRDVVIRHFNNHGSCLQQVLVGSAAVCGTARGAAASFMSKLNVKLPRIATTSSIPNSVYAAHKRVPKADREALRRRIVDWNKTPGGRRLIKRLNFSPFVSASDVEYEPVRNVRRRLNTLN